VARWRRTHDPFPAPLREFVASEWGPVEDECLEHFSCRGRGYGEDCVSVDGPCGWRFYAAFPEHAAAQRVKDARVRWRKARLSWLGEGHPDYGAEELRQLTEDP
jgi:hypothetical protein